MFAVIKTGGKQYRVEVGEILAVEKLDTDKGQTVVFDQVLLIEDNEKTLIGTPFVESAQVIGKIIENFKDNKVIVFKKKRRKQYRKKMGHRQELTRVKIEKIIPDVGETKERKPAKAKGEPKEAPKKPKAKGVKKASAAKKERTKTKKPEEKAKKPARKAASRKTKDEKTRAAAPKKKPSVKKPAKKKVTEKSKKTTSEKEK